MLRKRMFKVFSSLILLVFFCAGQVAAASNNSNNDVKQNFFSSKERDVNPTETPIPTDISIPTNTKIASASLAGSENPITFEGLLSIRWIDEFLPNGSVGQKQEYLIQDGYNKPIVFALEKNTAIPLGWPNRVVGQKILLKGYWKSGTNNVNSPTDSEPIFLANQITLLQKGNLVSLSIISGAQPYITILCKYPDELNVTYPKSWFETMMGSQYPGMDYFWQEVSYNNINLTGSAVAGWFDLPKTRAQYASNGGSVYDDCMAQADPNIYFPNYVGINVIIDKKCDTCLFVTANEYTGAIPFDGGGQYQITLSNTYIFTPHYILGVLQHEMGHAFGMSHSSGPYTDIYDSGWDVMSGYASGLHCGDWKSTSCYQDPNYAYLGPHPIAYNKTIPGWIPAGRIYNADFGTSSSITLVRLAQPPSGDYLMARIPIYGSATEFYTVEARKFIGYDAFLSQRESSEAVVIHKVDTTRDSNTGFSDVMDGDNNGNTNDAGSAWIPGESYIDAANDIAISVISSTTTGFVVKISNMISPTVISSVRADSDLTNSSVINFTVTFSRVVTGVDASDFALTTTGVSGAAISGVNGLGSTYTVTVNSGIGDGTIRLDVSDNDTIVNIASQPLGGVGTGNGDFTSGEIYTIDKTMPVISSIARVSASPSTSTLVNFLVTFSESVTGVDTSDFSLNTTGVVGATVNSVSGTGATRIVKVNTGSGDGTIRLDAVDDDTILDLASNPLNGGFTSGEVYTIDKPNLPAPVLRSPRTGMLTNTTTPTFWWTSVRGGASYEIEFAADSSFSSSLVSHVVSNISYTVVIPFSDGIYYWRVRAYNASNQFGAWSLSRTFTIDTTGPAAPALSSPANGASTRTPTFKWATVPGAVLYEFQYDDASNFSSPYDATTRSNFRKPPAMRVGTYSWQVRAKDASGNWGDWSATWTVNITSP